MRPLLQNSFRVLRTSTRLLGAFALCHAAASVSAKEIRIGHSALIGDGIVAFYPEGGIEGTSPSFALASEPREIGAAPASFTVVPHFHLREDGGSRAVVTVPPDADLYGTGEVTGPLRRNGRAIELWNTDNYGYERAEGRRLYQSHPWVLGVRADGTALGVLFDTTWESSLEIGADDGRIVLESEGPPFRVIVIDRESPQSVMRALADLTGHMPLPPRWALGFQQCKYSYYPDTRVREIADQFRARELPCDVIWMDIHYMDAYRVFTFDPGRFPDPSATNDYLHDRGFKGIWMIDPGVKAESGYTVYDSGTAKDVWVRTAGGKPFVGPVWPGDCVFPDFTMPETRSWWAGLYKPFMATGIDGVWNDMNEPAVFNEDTGWTMPRDNWHRGGGDLPAASHQRYHNVYGMLMVRASREGMLAASPERRPFILTRSNFLGGHRYAATWTGDNHARWEYLKTSIPMSLNLGLSGQPFSGPDIGGFSKNADPVLFGHWMAVGAFYPFSRAHNDNEADDKEPWAFGPEIERVAQTALFRRYRLLPYLYTQMEETARTGLPVMRPVFFADPTDRRLRDEDEAFLFGPDLLVVPKWAHRPVVPHGRWREVCLLPGDRENDAYQPALRIRDGAIIPLGEVVQNTTEDSLAPLTLLVSLDRSGRAEGFLYEDEGDGFAYREGDYARSRFVATTDGDRVIVKRAGREGMRDLTDRESVVQVVTDSGVFTARGDLAVGVEVELNEVAGAAR